MHHSDPIKMHTHSKVESKVESQNKLNHSIDPDELNSSYVNPKYMCTTDQYIAMLARANACGELMDETVCAAAANRGHLGALQWARHHNIPWDERTCAYAARHGFLDILQWARANGCPWNKATFIYAAKNGHENIMKWAINNGCPNM